MSKLANQKLIEIQSYSQSIRFSQKLSSVLPVTFSLGAQTSTIAITIFKNRWSFEITKCITYLDPFPIPVQIDIDTRLADINLYILICNLQFHQLALNCWLAKSKQLTGG